MSPLDDLKFAMQVLNDSKRVLVCNPDAESRVKTHLDARGMGGLYEVRPTPSCPVDRMYVIDEQGMAAEMAESLQQPIRVR